MKKECNMDKKKEKLIHCKICSLKIGALWGSDLCQNCQKGLQTFDNSSVRLQKAINYLTAQEPIDKNRFGYKPDEGK